MSNLIRKRCPKCNRKLKRKYKKYKKKGQVFFRIKIYCKRKKSCGYKE